MKTPDERWNEYASWFVPGTFKDPEIAHGFIMQVQQAVDEEREACAKIAEGWHDGRDWQHPQVAEAIRNRTKSSG